MTSIKESMEHKNPENVRLLTNDFPVEIMPIMEIRNIVPSNAGKSIPLETE